MNRKPAKLEINEEALRVNAAHRYLELSLNKEKHLGDIVKLASQICNTPIALITLIDETKQHFIAQIGLELECIDREESFCIHTLKKDDIMIIHDAIMDKKFVDNPLVIGTPYIRFYAGIALETYEGHKIGSLCVIDQKPNTLNKLQKDSLELLAEQVVNNIELRQTLSIVDQQQKILENTETTHKEKIDAFNEQLKNVISLQSHQIRGPITSLKGLLTLIKKEQPKINNEYLNLLEIIVNQLDDEIHEIVEAAHGSVLEDLLPQFKHF